MNMLGESLILDLSIVIRHVVAQLQLQSKVRTKLQLSWSGVVCLVQQGACGRQSMGETMQWGWGDPQCTVWGEHIACLPSPHHLLPLYLLLWPLQPHQDETHSYNRCFSLSGSLAALELGQSCYRSRRQGAGGGIGQGVWGLTFIPFCNQLQKIASANASSCSLLSSPVLTQISYIHCQRFTSSLNLDLLGFTPSLNLDSGSYVIQPYLVQWNSTFQIKHILSQFLE